MLKRVLDIIINTILFPVSLVMLVTLALPRQLIEIRRRNRLKKEIEQEGGCVKDYLSDDELDCVDFGLDVCMSTFEGSLFEIAAIAVNALIDMIFDIVYALCHFVSQDQS
ncbi:hypothetical protein IJG11_03370 [Candidatus Saccharibacteria bacterium]|nr:hypothetical protein [Candidatus Saccharibacteria bacterium]